MLNKGIPQCNFIVDNVSSVKTRSELVLNISCDLREVNRKKLSTATKIIGQCLFPNYKRAVCFGFYKPVGGLYKPKHLACVQLGKILVK